MFRSPVSRYQERGKYDVVSLKNSLIERTMDSKMEAKRVAAFSCRIEKENVPGGV